MPNDSNLSLLIGVRQSSNVGRADEVVMPKFHYIYLAQNLLKTRFPTSFEQKKVGNLVSDKIDLSRHVEIDLEASFRQIKKSGT